MEYRDVSVRGHDLVVGIAGEGPDLVLIPGHTMSIQRWVDAGYVDALARRRRVIALDPLGHGRSGASANWSEYIPARLVEHTLAAFDAADVDTADVWGYSRGALIASRVANELPERVRSLVYGGNVLFDPHPFLEAMGLVLGDDALDAAHERALDGDWGAYWETFPLPLPEETKRLIERDNDLPSISASGIAGVREPIVFTKPDAVQTFAYWGSDEIFHQINIDTASDLGLPIATVSGGHAGAFDPADEAIAAVTGFLDRLDM